MTRLYQPSQNWPACTLSYRHFHLLWTLPLCAVLFLVARPFLTKLDRAKLILLPIIAFVWTTPWDNLIVKNRAWFYHRHCIWFTIGYVPVEEYFFFIIQSLLSTLWCTLLTRWALPNLYVVPSSSNRTRLATPAVVVCLLCFVGGLKVAVPETHSYYFGMITWWASLPLALLLWGSIDFVRNMGVRAGLVPFALSVLAPTVYLWCSDIYALRRGTWHINEATSLNIFPIPDLPIEEMLFFLVTNLILVSACFTFDRCVAICRQSVSDDTPPLSPSYLPLGSLDTYTKLWAAFVRSDRRSVAAGTSTASASVEPRDLAASLQVLRAASKSFSAASLLLPWDLRTDLGCLYAFCRVADDLVDDDARGLEAKSTNLDVIRAIVDAIYADSHGGGAEKKQQEPVSERIAVLLAPVALPDKIKQDTRAAAASIAPLTRYIPRRLWYEMLQGYSMDLLFEHPDAQRRTRLESMDDLVEYSQCVAGVVGEMCTRVILGRCGAVVPLDLQVDRKITLRTTKAGVAKKREVSGRTLDLKQAEDVHALLYEARRMGVSLQLVNIARDIVPDSVELRRCYLPTDVFDKEDAGMQDALLTGRINVPKQKSPDAKTALVQPQDVRKYALRLLHISKGLYDHSYPALAQIPNRPARAGLKAACSVYAAIGTRIEAQTQGDIAKGTRARMSNADRILRAISAVYLGI
ncbi:hypothetical protein EX895_004664 [Sporisorium graminicola]|uniref:Bifunctional lycopene cyclase/phytoene synthase n=1 Tax=Sporisorium graminicola TaxID=280036 RepID=A0A4U7KPX7_9BASI|nr:hypothetical protein EX895_004664 [Sporisorium graminicola]TKY86515.1 hypothetical protein EX895_004664 [Sporisorium graminicola]